MAVSLAGGLLSVLAAAALSVAVGTQRINMLISYAIGALLGAAFLEILPEALDKGEPHKMAATVLFGIMVFFVLEKLVLWRHCHHDHCEAHEAHAPAHDHGRSGLLILVGDTFHNFVDGILIAAAFLADPALGVTTTLAIVAHEIPQELGDFVLLLNAGWSKRLALLANAASSLTSLLGGLLGYYFMHDAIGIQPYVLTLAAASFIYIAVADLLPLLHRQANRHFAGQAGWIAAGVAIVPGVAHWLH